MAQQRALNESMTDSAAPPVSEALVRARRRFFGTLFLFILSALLLPWVMDSQPPETLPSPTIRLVTEGQPPVVLHGPPPAQVIPESSVEAPSANREEAPLQGSSQGDGSASSHSAPKGGEPVAAGKPMPSTPSEKGAGKGGESPVSPSAKVAEKAPPPPPPAPTSPAPSAAPTSPVSSPPVASSHGEVPRWSLAQLHDRAKAQAALQGFAATQPLTQFWYVQAGAYKSETQAAEVVSRLRAAKLSAYLMAGEGGWYRVRVAPFVSKEEADAAAEKVARVIGGKPQVGAQRVGR